MNVSIKDPSFVTILVWTKKIGCYQVQKKIQKADDWIIILDESIEFGHDKLLVIYGLKSSKIDFTRSLNYKDLTCLCIAAKSSWTGDLIKMEIDKLKEKMGKIIYAVADGGNAINKSLRMSNIPHIYDITHKIAWILKEMYGNEKSFIEYTKTMAKMRGSLSLSSVSHILPPNQRVNSRFMNIDLLSDWGIKVLNYLDRKNDKEKEYQKLKWVANYRELISELKIINQTIAEIKTLFKTKGMSVENIKKTKKELSKIPISNNRIELFKNELTKYFNQIQGLDIKKRKILCTSDIIESAFGKYKNYINDNPMLGITNLALCISAFTSSLDTNEIKLALETIKMRDLNKWSEENIGQTNMARRRNIFKMG